MNMNTLCTFQQTLIMWIVRLALRRPYSVAVMAFLITILGIMSIRSMMADIFPVIDIPVVNMIWNYTGLSAADMERKVVYLSGRGFSTPSTGSSGSSRSVSRGSD
jgi:Cu/Ag efflux pump CusA